VKGVSLWRLLGGYTAASGGGGGASYTRPHRRAASNELHRHHQSWRDLWIK